MSWETAQTWQPEALAPAESKGRTWAGPSEAGWAMGTRSPPPTVWCDGSRDRRGTATMSSVPRPETHEYLEGPAAATDFPVSSWSI